MKGLVNIWILVTLFINLLYGQQADLTKNSLSIKQCLLPKTHPIYVQLHEIFTDLHQFDSPDHWRKSGFYVNERAHRGLMVGSHPSIQGYLFKKFDHSISQKEQILNYLRRINGARNLSKFIASNQLKFIVVPKKWLFPLPKKFNNTKTNKKTYLLVVEKMNICGGELDRTGEIEQCYRNIDIDVLRELCMVVFNFRGLDSVLRNMPFTYQGQIAFIDTERWARKRDGFLLHVMPFLNADKKAVVLGVIQELQLAAK
ncbi:MAG: hypothetical protein Q8K60_07330 [Parachlamydiaceae bacterium]|nr:hypothetical protein [Parachlamydiaceae bacterium]